MQEAGLSQAALQAGAAYGHALESAGSAYAAHQFPKALEKLDMADQIQPEIPDTYIMRGAIYAEQHEFAKAQAAFEKAGKLNPGDFWPPYNVAELLLVQKKFGQASAAFQKLLVYQGHDELLRFKIVFTSLMNGKPEDAKPALDAMKFPSDTPAYYFAHSAWGFAHQDAREGNYWARAGIKVFGIGRCVAFYDTLAQVGWLPARNADGSLPEAQELAAPPAEPGTLPGGLPGVNLQPLPGVTP